jgi:hypothetical protein
MGALESGFQCERVGGSVTAGRSEVGMAGSSSASALRSGVPSVRSASVFVPAAFFK